MSQEDDAQQLARLVFALAKALHTTPEKVLQRLTRKDEENEREEA